jgi:hypothetical protein
MIERIDDMPPETVGLRARGKLTKSDYTDVLEPALREAIASGELRLLFLLTDSGWVARAARMFTWLTPGEVLIVEPDRLDDARRWVTG